MVLNSVECNIVYEFIVMNSKESQLRFLLWISWENIMFRKWDPPGQFVWKVGKSALGLEKKNSIIILDASVHYYVWSGNSSHKAKHLEDMRFKFPNGNIQLLPNCVPMTRSLVKESIGGNVENLDQHQHELCCPLWRWQSW